MWGELFSPVRAVEIRINMFAPATDQARRQPKSERRPPSQSSWIREFGFRRSSLASRGSALKLVVNQRFARDAVGDSCISKDEQQLGTTRLEQASSDASFTLICH